MKNTHVISYIKEDSCAYIAELLATLVHKNQFRRDGVTEYITHPAAVAKRLSGESKNVIATAWLHDVLENTGLTKNMLIDVKMPEDVIEAVDCLTKRSSESYEYYLKNVRKNKIALKVKIADMLHNLSDTPTKKQIIKYARGLLTLLT